jgi:hypothetical protein
MSDDGPTNRHNTTTRNTLHPAHDNTRRTKDDDSDLHRRFSSSSWPILPSIATTMSMWDSIKSAAQKAGNVAMIAGQKTKLTGEILLADREVKGRKQKFGVELYDLLGPMASSPDFFAADDPLTTTLRPPLLTAQREIAALAIKRGKIKEDIAQAEIKRKASFPDKAMTIADKMKNGAKSAGLAGNEAKLATELSMVEGKIRTYKQEFGLTIYEIFVDLEDQKSWLPTDRNIRSMYDQARKDVEKLIQRRTTKVEQLEALGGSYAFDKKEEGQQGETGFSDDMQYNAPVTPAVPRLTPAPVPAPVAAQGMFAYSGQPSTAANTPAPAAQGMFAYPGQPSTAANAQSYTAPTGFPSAPQPTSEPSYSMGSGGYQAPAPAPISQTSSYMQSTMRVSDPPSGGGYSDAPPMGGYSDSAPMGGFADFSGASQTFPQPTVNNNSDPFATSFPSSQSGSNSRNNPPQDQNDLFLF